jgi:GNAT superfamily N-acetyltransferase
MSSVTETSTSALGKQGEMLFFLVFQGAKLAVCAFVRMGVAPELWVEKLRRGRGVGVWLLLGTVSDRPRCQCLYVERELWVIALGAQQMSANAIVVRLHHWFAVAWARSPTSFASDC